MVCKGEDLHLADVLGENIGFAAVRTNDFRPAVFNGQYLHRRAAGEHVHAGIAGGSIGADVETAADHDVGFFRVIVGIVVRFEVRIRRGGFFDELILAVFALRTFAAIGRAAAVIVIVSFAVRDNDLRAFDIAAFGSVAGLDADDGEQEREQDSDREELFHGDNRLSDSVLNEQRALHNSFGSTSLWHENQNLARKKWIKRFS